MNPPILPLTLLLHALPDRLHTEVVSRLCNHLLKGQWLGEQLHELDGKRIAIRINDTGSELAFAVQGGRLVRQGDGGWDVRISGDLEGFWQLATRAEDPDTLFFNRRLAIEGETATGLHLKNMLDAMDFDPQAHLEAVLGPRWVAVVRGFGQRVGLDRRVRQLFGRVG